MIELIVSTKSLMAFVNAVRFINTEMTVRPNGDHLECYALDSANTALVHATLLAGAFESYTFTDESVSFSCSETYKILKDLGGEYVALVLKDRDSHIEVIGGRKKYRVQTYDERTVTGSVNAEKLENVLKPLTFNSHFSMDFKDFLDALDAVKLVNEDKVHFEHRTSTSLTFIGEGDQNNVEVHYNEGEGGLKFYTSPVSVPLRATFSFDYIKDFMKGYSKGFTDILQVQTGYQIPITFEGDAGPAVTVFYVLAPRIEND